MNCIKSSYCMQNNFIPDASKYFKEELISNTFTISYQKPDIEKIIDITTYPEVENMRLIDTRVATSNEGQHLSGTQLLVELRIKQKITYAACEYTQTVHVAYYQTLKSIFVVLPNEVNSKNIYDLFRAQRITATPFIEGECFRKLDCKNIFDCYLLFLNVTIC